MPTFRYLRVTGATLDGTTPLTTDWSPDINDRNQPYSWVDQEVVGRISPSRWLTRGSIGAIITAKNWQPNANGPVVLTSRSPTSAELGELKPPANVPDAPPAGALDEILESRNLSPSSWSTPLLVTPEHALTLFAPGSAGPGGDTVEMIIIDVGNAEMMQYINGVLAAEAASGGDVFVTAVTADIVVPTFAGTQYILANPAGASATITLPAAGAVVDGTTLVVTRIGGGFVEVAPAGADTINGQTQVVLLNDMGQATFVRISGQWLSSDAPITAALVLTNVVVDGSVPLPIATGTNLVEVNFTERGSITLPSIADVAPGVEYLIVRVGDNATVPRAVRLIPAAGEPINGEADLIVFLSNPGSALRLRLRNDGVGVGSGGWDVVSDRQSTESQTLSYAADQVLDSGTPDEKMIRATQPAAQTITLPLAAQTAIGTKYKVTAFGAGGLTIQSGLSTIIGGGNSSSDTVFTIAQNDTALLTFDDGATWQIVLSDTYVQSVSSAINVALAIGWRGLRIFRFTQAAAAILTMPAATALFIGMEVQAVTVGAGGLTINGNGVNIINAGASAATLVLAQFVPRRLVFDGTTWQAA